MSFPAYPAYKKSDVEWLGEVPEHWTLTPLKYLALLNPRKSDYDGDTEQLCSFVPMEKLKTGAVQLDEERSILEVIGGYTYFEDGDVLQAKVTPCFENKNIAIAKGLTNGIGFGSSEINVLRPYQGVNAEYLYYRVQEDSYMDFCTSSMIGAGGLKRVPTDVINNFKVATPEEFEQTQIARFLDHETARIDALIEEQQRLIELLKEKRQAVISHAVTKGLDPTVPMKDSGVEWLGEVPANWEVTRLRRICVEINDINHVMPVAVESGVPFLSAKDLLDDGTLNFTEDIKMISESDFMTLSKKICPRRGDIIYSRIGACLGKARLVETDDRFLVSYSCCVVRVIESIACSRFIQHLLDGEMILTEARMRTQGIGVPDLGLGEIGRFPIALPPVREQQLIARYLDDKAGKFDTLITEARLATSLLQEHRSALVSAAVTGKIDVRGWQPPASAATPELVQEAV